MKIGIITGCGLGASEIYKRANLDVSMYDIDLKILLEKSYESMDIVPHFREAIKWFISQDITHGTIGCNTFDTVGLELLQESNIIPINSINKILFNEVKKYDTVGWISTSIFRSKIPNLSTNILHISENDQKVIDEIIFNELAWCVVKDSSIKVIKNIISSLKCEYTVLGCTDLSLMSQYLNTKVIDSTQLHINILKQCLIHR